MIRPAIALSALVLCAAPAMAGEPNPPTYAEDIAPILHSQCSGCHRPDQAAPFSLLSYKDAAKKARMIRRVIDDRLMPPWPPEKACAEFVGERHLTAAQIDLIGRWVEAGAPEGDPAKTPEPPKFESGWAMGEPDLVVEMNDFFDIPASGRDIYRYFVLPLDLPEDKWVTAVDIRPSARTVVHHVLFFVDETGEARKHEAKDGKPGFSGGRFRRTNMGGWTPGETAVPLTGGLAWPVKKGSDLVLQTHFHPSGKAEREKTTVALYFADKTPERSMLEFQIPALFGRFAGIDIPAGEADWRLKESLTLEHDIDLMSIGGHAHQVCVSFDCKATLPGGEVKSLLSIPEWDFDWQGQYHYKEPLRLPAGTVLDVEICYDNSDKNPQNPFSPPRHVKWGEQSNDEMGSIIFYGAAAEESNLSAIRESIKQQQRQQSADTVRKRIAQGGDGDILKALAGRGIMEKIKELDTNNDGALQLSEVPKSDTSLFIFRLADSNGDNVVDAAEMDAMEAKLRGAGGSNS